MPGRWLRRGDRFRVSGGPVYRLWRQDRRGDRQGLLKIGVRGVFELSSLGIGVEGRRYIEAVRVGPSGYGGQYLLYVSGPDYWHSDLPGVRMRPYRLRKITERTQQRIGLPIRKTRKGKR